MIVSLLKKLKVGKAMLYLRKRSAFISYWYTYLLLIKNAEKRALLVYTMGKVGSSTITQSLDNELEGYSVYQLHWLTSDNLHLDMNFHRALYKKHADVIQKKSNSLPDYIVMGFYIRNKLAKLVNVENDLKICTLVRDPVERNISSFFQNLTTFYGYDVKKRLESQDEDSIVEELKDIFLKDYAVNNGISFIDCDPLTWFENELEEVFEIDVYNSAFPKEKGYSVSAYGNKSLLIIRLEDLNKCFSEAIEIFLGTSITIRKNKNTGQNKAYASVYKKFKDTIVLPDWYLDKYYDSKYARHFYTEREILNFRKKWKNEG